MLGRAWRQSERGDVVTVIKASAGALVRIMMFVRRRTLRSLGRCTRLHHSGCSSFQVEWTSQGVPHLGTASVLRRSSHRNESCVDD